MPQNASAAASVEFDATEEDYVLTFDFWEMTEGMKATVSSKSFSILMDVNMNSGLRR